MGSTWLQPHPLSTELDESEMPPTTPVDENECRITKCERMCKYVLGKWKVIAFGQVLAFWLVSAGNFSPPVIMRDKQHTRAYFLTNVIRYRVAQCLGFNRNGAVKVELGL